MTERERAELLAANPILRTVARGREVVWINPDRVSMGAGCDAALSDHGSGCDAPPAGSAIGQTITQKDIDDAEARLKRFAPLIMSWFPETAAREGIIESELVDIPKMQKRLADRYGAKISGRLMLKKDSDLPIAGSIKARGGIYEVLKHTEDVAIENGLLTGADASSYLALAAPKAREVFSRYTVQVGSTGNLGLSIGIMSAAIGFRVIVHMSADAKRWKKELLRLKGVNVMEYQSDYSEAVRQGRARSDQDPHSYFIDDEKSVDLFLGYAVAAGRLKKQLEEKGIAVDKEHPLFVYIPCGVGGAPGGITYGLRQLFGDHVHCFFAEPTQAPCMLLGIVSGLFGGICVQDIGLLGKTEADGLAVGRPSDLVSRLMISHVSGEVTVEDRKLFSYLRDIGETERIFLEPSACAGFEGAVKIGNDQAAADYLRAQAEPGDGAYQRACGNAAHIVWATGGSFVPEEVRGYYYAG